MDDMDMAERDDDSFHGDNPALRLSDAPQWRHQNTSRGSAETRRRGFGHMTATRNQQHPPHFKASLAYRDQSGVCHNVDGPSTASSNTASPDDMDVDGQRPGDTTSDDADGEESVEEIPRDSHTSDEEIAIRAPLRGLALTTDDQFTHDIGQWYFLTQMPENDLQFFESAQDHWVKGIWEMARISQPMYAAMGSFALHKKAALSGPQARPQYYEQKGRMIQEIVANLQTSQGGPDPYTLVAIAILGYLDIRDGEFQSAETHLQAVCKFIDMASLSPHAWLYCVWIDLRYALFTGKEPMLPFYIPAAYRELPGSVLSCQQEASRLGSINASECPRSPLFTLDMACDLFRKLHALCFCSDVLLPSEDPPFGQVYALEYGLRVVQARAQRSHGEIFNSSIVLLVTCSIQLHVWMASRFWTPQRRESHLSLITRASKLIHSFDDLVTEWYIFAGLESLLWVLFTIVATLRAHEHPETQEILDLLHKAFQKARITQRSDFESRLQRWPWLRNWHPVQISELWATLSARFSDLVPAEAPPQASDSTAVSPKARYRWFIGGLEFFNSL